ncbi:FecR domain-containing protein [Xylophilus sp. GW821-FHT01B05]
MSSAAVDSRAAREAAQWLVRVQSGDAKPAELASWRAADPCHEAAWLRAERVVHALGLANGPAALFGPLGASALRQSSRAGRRAAVRVLALLIVAGPAAWAAWRYAPEPWGADERTATGERRDITLPDGSRVVLDTASAADIAFSPAARRLVLREGALWVQTVADPAGRPFLVQTAQGTARALGTRFTVRSFAAEAGHDATTQVAVMQGAVELRPANGPASVIAAGQQARMSAEGTTPAESLQPEADGWTHGVLYAEKLPLGAFCAELSRYRPGLLRCDPAVSQLPVSGAFQLGDTDAVLTALAASLPLRIELRTRYWVQIGPR